MTQNDFLKMATDNLYIKPLGPMFPQQKLVSIRYQQQS